MIKIIVNSDEELIALAADAIHLLNNVRNAQIDWFANHGAEKLRQRKRWEKKADDFLDKLKNDSNGDQKEPQNP